MKNLVILPNGKEDIRTATKNAKTHALVGKFNGEWRVLSLHINESLAVTKKLDWESGEGWGTSDSKWSDLTILDVKVI